MGDGSSKKTFQTADRLREDGVDVPSVSVLVLTYNHQSYIENCLRSILVLDYPNFEVFVLDDGSGDDTYKTVERVAAESSIPIRLMRQTNSGGRTAENSQKLVDHSGGKYILFMSGDDMLGPNFPLRSEVAQLEANPETGLILPRVVALNMDPAESAPNFYTKRFLLALRAGKPDVILHEHLHTEVSRIFLQGMIVRRSLVNKVGGFDVDLAADDYAFVFRLFREMQRSNMYFLFNEVAFWIYRLHQDNVHRNTLRQLTLIIEVVAKYVPRTSWRTFDWHVGALDSWNEFGILLQHSRRFLGETVSDDLVERIGRRTLRQARRSGNRPLLRACLKCPDVSLGLRFRALMCLIQSAMRR